MAGVGLALAVAGAIASGGALVGAIGSAGSMMSAMATSSGATAAAAAMVDVVSVAAEIGATASLATNNTSLGTIFGWVGLGTGLVSSAAGTAAWRTAKIVASKPEVRLADDFMKEVKAARKPADRILDVPDRSKGSVPMRTAGERPESRTYLYRFTHPDNDEVVRYAVDSTINAYDAVAMVKRIALEHPNAEMYYYYGAHGAASGKNWVGEGAARVVRMPETPKRLDYENRLLITFLEHHGRGLKDRFHAEVLHRWSDLPAKYRRPGVHIDTACYGASDLDLAELFHAHPVPAAHVGE
ncbi:hypothetical protein VI08_09810 [Luteibacter yeojuensis]|uniref:Uncharacterized protein n=2 Tax=Luteibacter yeojuensis TaxID=345309 RepID=A0A0F3KTQ4_9GAMM|nr:hypothetical protein VI08_09810 [Luteibacter yeojuensis]